MTPYYSDPLVTLLHGDCLEVLATLEADSVDAVVTDPPYGLEFMSKDWDAPWRTDPNVGQQWQRGMGKVEMPDGAKRLDRPSYDRTANVKCRSCGKWQVSSNPCKCERPDFPNLKRANGLAFQAWCEQWGREALRVTKPGGYLLAFGGTRTHHRLVCALEDAGWIIRDELDWIYACLSDDTEILTNEGWVRYNRASEATHAAAFDPATGKLRWERIEAVHQYDHEGPMAEVGPSLVTLNHRVVLDRATGRVPRVSSVWIEIPSSLGMGEADGQPVMLSSMQRAATDTRPSIPAGSPLGVDSIVVGVLPREDDWSGQPSLEGRRYRVQEARELLGSSVRPGAGVGASDGSEGRVHHGASATDGRAHGLPVDPDGVREPREPRPDRQPPRESDPLAGQPDPQALRAWEGARGDGLPTGDTPSLVDYAGMVWCITVPSGAFVARRNGVAFVTGNSGFPKGRANLKPAHEPIVLARKPGKLRELGIEACRIGYASDADKPDQETWNLKGSTGAVGGGGYIGQKGAGMMQAYAEGKIPVPSGRWPSNVLLSSPELFDEPNPYVVGSGATTTSNVRDSEDRDEQATTWALGRTGVTLRGHEDSGGYSRFFLVPKSDRAERERGLADRPTKRTGTGALRAEQGGEYRVRVHEPDPAEIAAYLRKWRQKAGLSMAEMDKRLGTNTMYSWFEGRASGIQLPTPETYTVLKQILSFDDTYDEVMTATRMVPHAVRGEEVKVSVRANVHPTVKPIDLMRHLVRLVTPNGGTVLDPFLGSGTTALAASEEGFRCVGIERELEYLEIAKGRLMATPMGFGLSELPA